MAVKARKHCPVVLDWLNSPDAMDALIDMILERLYWRCYGDREMSSLVSKLRKALKPQDSS